MAADTHVNIAKLGKNGGGSQPTNIISSENSIDVESITRGYDINVSSELIDKINGKQDIPNAGGLLTSGIEAHYMGINLSSYPTICIDAQVGTYVPIFEIDAFNNGKSQLSFEIISREDSAGYYSKFIFVSIGDSYLFIRTDYYNRQLTGTSKFDRDAIVVVKKNRKYLICKKVINSGFDCFITNDIYRDLNAYCRIYCYTSVEAIPDPTRIRRASPMTTYEGLDIATSGVQPTDLERLAQNVAYDDTTTQTGITNVQAALENIFTRLNTAGI